MHTCYGLARLKHGGLNRDLTSSSENHDNMSQRHTCMYAQKLVQVGEFEDHGGKSSAGLKERVAVE